MTGTVHRPLELTDLVEPESRGCPTCPLRWTAKSTRILADQLGAEGFTVSHSVVGQLLGYMGYSLQGLAKNNEGESHPDRDAQFAHLAGQVNEHTAACEPVISVDTKKKELVGDYKNAGVEYQPAGQPQQVNGHDFPDPKVGKAIPYGIYDTERNEGWGTGATRSPGRAAGSAPPGTPLTRLGRCATPLSNAPAPPCRRTRPAASHRPGGRTPRREAP